jgi:hypothetical protein
MTTPHGEERPIDLSDLPGEEGVDPADAAERLDEDPDDISRNQEQRPEVETDGEGR